MFVTLTMSSNCSNWNEDKLAGGLAKAILSVESMPSHQVTLRYAIDNYSDTDEEYQKDRIPIMRICRV